ncbi:helix-hairpin-helix domain-containing protein [Haloarcula sediminis]|uniref:helix-hairpin-helix domain-containing protein n=1 Tax=Haloarcula sediminis TaxID=3111777 RepID=UPI002D788AD3|nr:helix-hairpin-helix domain-containing protein [Haloarcula sp. CK38]
MSVALPEDLHDRLEAMSDGGTPDMFVTEETAIEAALNGVAGVTDEVIRALRDAGFENEADLRAASPAAYRDIDGINAALADAIVSHLNDRDAGDDSDSSNTSA